MSNFWDNEEVLSTIEQDKGHKIIVKAVSKGMSKFIDIRKYYTDKDGVVLPTSKGIAIPDDLVDEIAQVMVESGCSDYTKEDEEYDEED